ncbi:pitrilysin family protein [Thiohalobacter sp. IOR34]|uniref:M16 family metallopeptidase n=1 Tax=Thiohalobacter sp. IOR34 TaxID=3057176 RepID=UPI0025B17FF0|nr:pitrilysin family protein [Thiohalobacter sp. IOR34]WJW75746.1 pitrilysin family protein [Thiohalobacter sp. IOR34]
MTRSVQRMALLLAGLWLCGAAWAGSAVHEYRLDNGLRLLVKEDHRAPVVVAQVWYRVGSSYEYDGITGISHVLEHMMFKGTAKHGPGEFSRIIAENGGRENAFTSRDYTAYFQRLEKGRLPVSFELEADRMRNLKLDQAEFAKEVRVVMEERRMRTEDNAEALTYEQFNATAFLTSPYRIPTIGWMDDLQNLRLQDLERWYAMWYAPNNATLVVAGDVDPEAVFELAKTYYGPLQPSEIEPLKPRREIEQRGLRRIRVKAPAEVPYLIMGYKVPVLLTAEAEWEPYALEVLAGILDGGNSARLARELVRGSQVAASAGAGYDLYDRQQSLLLLEGTPASGRSIDELEAALRRQVQRLRSKPVAADELERVKAQVVADQVYQQDSVFYQAMQLGMLVSVGLDWRLAEQHVARIQAVTPEQVQAVARKYLVDDRLTLAVLDPQPMDAESRARARAAKGGAGHGH